MDILEAVSTRKSIRGFKPDPVPRDTLRQILAVACRAPSGSNIQPWEFAVVAGETLDRIKRDNATLCRSGADPRPERRSAEKLPGTLFKARQIELGSRLYALMGITRQDEEKRLRWREKGARFFDAPSVILISTDRSLAQTGALTDIGMVAQTICLVAMHFGLGTCIVGQGLAYPEIIRKHLAVPASKKLMIAIAVGYPDWGFPANRLETPRAPIDEITTWWGFDEGPNPVLDDTPV
ncbi:MAG: nitroreductase [Thermodesulfobacteriota bacterium]